MRIAAARYKGKDFNPRSPRGGATFNYKAAPSPTAFQSTLPTRGSDGLHHGHIRAVLRISIHAPHEGERRKICGTRKGAAYFNPRSPRGGATMICSPCAACWVYFNPRSPRGGATPEIAVKQPRRHISIHAPHEGERLRRTDTRPPRRGVISIHAPHEGERPDMLLAMYTADIFQSTLPTRGSDIVRELQPTWVCGISIHAPHEGERRTKSGSL